MRLSDIFFPSGIKCVFCGKEVDGDINICAECITKLPYIAGKTCFRCGGHVLEEDVCMDCAKSDHMFVRNFAVFDYDGILRDKILSFKQAGKKYIGHAFAPFIYEKYKEIDIPFDMVIPMPISKEREKERGFNQADILVEDIESNEHNVRKDIVFKVKNTPHQTGLSKENRQTNLDGAFAVRDKSLVKGKTILIVDDIYTTGATMSQVAETLMKAKARAVYGLTLARAKIRMD